MYWTDDISATGDIQRANLDGSGVTDLVTDLGSNPGALALDLVGDQMYWGAFGLSDTTRIQRANLDGSGITDVVEGLRRVSDIALDVGGGQMYWTNPVRSTTDPSFSIIQRANLDGTDVTNLTERVDDPSGIALDLDAGHIYFTAEGLNPIPLPATVWLFGSGLIGLIGLARRKKS